MERKEQSGIKRGEWKRRRRKKGIKNEDIKEKNNQKKGEREWKRRSSAGLKDDNGRTEDEAKTSKRKIHTQIYKRKE